MGSTDDNEIDPKPRWWSVFVQIPSGILIAIIRLYQIFLSPIFGRQCRFHPTCSEYTLQAIKKYGAILGSIKGTRRICRCHPWNPGGYDPP